MLGQLVLLQLRDLPFAAPFPSSRGINNQYHPITNQTAVFLQSSALTLHARVRHLHLLLRLHLPSLLETSTPSLSK
jgi:hypothetical protein